MAGFISLKNYDELGKEDFLCAKTYFDEFSEAVSKNPFAGSWSFKSFLSARLLSLSADLLGVCGTSAREIRSDSRIGQEFGESFAVQSV